MDSKTSLTNEHKAWLARGGPFPDEFDLIRSDQSKIKYEIADLDQNGYISDILSRAGSKGFVLKIKDPTTNAFLAAKFCRDAEYPSLKDVNTEARRANLLQGAGNVFALPRSAGYVDSFEGQPNSDSQWACFISDWIDGETLDSRISKNPESITPHFVIEVGYQLFQAIFYLSAKQLKHDDLHIGNLMLQESDPAIMIGRETSNPIVNLCVIDTGSLKDINQSTSKPFDDWSQAAKVLTKLYNSIYSNRYSAVRHVLFLKKLKALIQDLLETDASRVFPEPKDYFNRLDELKETLHESVSKNQLQFSIFDGLSAENLTDDGLLLDLFTDLPWMNTVSKSNSTLLTGPRGCGKSMLFRALSLRTKLSRKNINISDIENLPFVGIYISCAQDLQGDVLWISRKPEAAQNHAHLIISLFITILTRELFRLIDRLISQSIIRDALELNIDKINQLINLCRDYIPSASPTPCFKYSLSVASDYADELDRVRRTLSRDLVNELSNASKVPESFLRDLAKHFLQFFPGFHGLKICFLLDDYTSFRIPKPVQAVLNSLIFARNDSYFFKVSCEKFGFEASSDTAVRIDPNREFEPIDAGYEVDNTTHAKNKTFLTDLINRRLVAGKWKGTAEQLIGNSKYPQDTDLAIAIRSAGPGKSFFYNGLNTLANTWGGDIATLIHMVRDMFSRADVKPETIARIPDQYQHDAIVAVSRAHVENVQRYEPYGNEMYRILNSFAQLAKDLLATAELNSRDIPQRRYRFEMTLPENTELFDLLSDEQENLTKELLRRAVFVDCGPSRGKERKSSKTVRWELRKSLRPAFGLSLIRESYLDFKEPQQFIDMLVSADSFTQVFISKYKATPTTGDLFDERSKL